jgi:hypothetical protein
LRSKCRPALGYFCSFGSRMWLASKLTIFHLPCALRT